MVQRRASRRRARASPMPCLRYWGTRPCVRPRWQTCPSWCAVRPPSPRTRTARFRLRRTRTCLPSALRYGAWLRGMTLDWLVLVYGTSLLLEHKASVAKVGDNTQHGKDDEQGAG